MTLPESPVRHTVPAAVTDGAREAKMAWPLAGETHTGRQPATLLGHVWSNTGMEP